VVLIAKRGAESRSLFRSMEQVPPALQKMTPKEWVAELGKGEAAAANVRRLLRWRMVDAYDGAKDYSEWSPPPAFLRSQSKEFGKLTPAEATAAKRALGRAIAELDGRVDDLIPDFTYSWLFK